MKIATDRARPAVDQLTHAIGPSFPSGRAATAAATFAIAAVVLARSASGRRRVVPGAVAAAIAAAVAARRVVLGVHWVTDVVAGVVVGWSWCAVCVLALAPRAAQAPNVERVLASGP